MVERQSERKIKVLRSDNGKEYVNDGFEKYLKQHGIQHQKTTAYTPEQNGMAERANRSIVERARCLLFEAGLAKTFWAEAVHTSVYLLNRSPTQGHNSTPEHVWSGKKPNLSHLRIFGTKAMVHIPKERRRKLDPKSRECVFVGYDDYTKGYRLYDPQSSKVFTSREVCFIDEGTPSAPVEKQRQNLVPLDFEFVSSSSAASDSDTRLVEETEYDEDEDEFFTDYESGSEEDFNGFDLSQETVIDVTPVLPPRKTSNPPQSQVLRRSAREHKIPGKYDEFHVTCKGLPHSKPLQEADTNAGNLDTPVQLTPQGQLSGIATAVGMAVAEGPLPKGDPDTYQEALSREDAALWKRAMREEYDALMANDTWTLTELPVGRKPIK